MNTFAWIGLIGLGASLLVNLLAWALGQDTAVPFAPRWWGTWTPVYVVWMVFGIIGLSQARKAPGSAAEEGAGAAAEK